MSKISTYFWHNGGRFWFLADPVTFSIIITGRNYCYQNHSIKETFKAICYKILISIWNCKVAPPRHLLVPWLKIFKQKDALLKLIEHAFRYFGKCLRITEIQCCICIHIYIQIFFLVNVTVRCNLLWNNYFLVDRKKEKHVASAISTLG